MCAMPDPGTANVAPQSAGLLLISVDGVAVLVHHVDHPQWARVTRVFDVLRAACGWVGLVQHHEALRVGSEDIWGKSLTYSSRRAVFGRDDHSPMGRAHIVPQKVADSVAAGAVSAAAPGEPPGLNRQCMNAPLLIENRYAPAASRLGLELSTRRPRLLQPATPTHLHQASPATSRLSPTPWWGLPARGSLRIQLQATSAAPRLCERGRADRTPTMWPLWETTYGHRGGGVHG